MAASKPPFRLAELADLLEATLIGPPDILISAIRGIEEAGSDHLTFISNPKYASQAKTTAAGAILVDPGFPEIATPTLRVKDPYLTFARAIALFYQPPAYPAGTHPTAVISPSARIGRGAHIGAFVCVMDEVEIGDDAVLLPHSIVYPGVRAGHRLLLHAHAVVREHCILADDVTVGNGAVIGGDGFGFAKRPDGDWQKIPQSGVVILESGVEIQANACIDRASIGETRIQAGAKVDNLVQVGHGSQVGRNTLLCSQVGLAGSTRVGDRVILAGQVGVAGHCTIGDGVVATAQSGIPSDVPPNTTISGYPAVENRQWLKSVAALNRLPALLRNLNKELK